MANIIVEDSNIVEVFENDEGNVKKYIFYNGAELCLKTISGCSKDGSPVDNQKAVLFISSSVGCRQGCKFCYLTVKKYKYRPLSEDAIIQMCINVIKREKDILKDRYLKLSFMGMGDVLDDYYPNIAYICRNIFNYAIFNHVLKEPYIKGIDGVDIGTSMPNDKWESCTHLLKEMEEFNRYLNDVDVNFNPNNKYITDIKVKTDVSQRTKVRLFVSLHAADDGIRKFLMPNTMSLDLLQLYLSNLNIDLIFHTMFLKGINDDVQQRYGIYKFVNSFDIIPELRVLRFNKCPEMKLDESPYIHDIIEEYKKSDIPFKYQVSPGSEISAACGQFICKVIEK